MKYIYKISQTKNDDYDTYDSAIVVAESEEKAKLIHPNGFYICEDGIFYRYSYHEKFVSRWKDESWCELNHVKAELIGTASDDLECGAVICASFNAG